jgi:hypothetical protein
MLGHALGGLGEAKASAILQQYRPDALLATSIAELDGLLTLPLFLVERQELVRKRVVAKRLLLMGESEPMPEDVELSDALEHRHAPYLGLRDGALLLHPLLRWGLAIQRAHYGIYFLDALEKRDARYVTVNDDQFDGNDEVLADIRRALSGEPVALELVRTAAGKDFLQEWLERRRELERLRGEQPCEIPWAECDGATLSWYATRFDEAGPNESPQAIIQKQLLDGRDQLDPPERRQFVLLFGTDDAIRRAIERAVVDLRARKQPEVRRFDERVECTSNVIQALRTAVDFFGRHVGIGGVTLDGFQATSGSADYIALREALVNLLIHQDYGSKVPGQIEITQERTTFFNGGRSLVKDVELFEGARSQSRNPLISRALKLIGFAELAGSGLREVDRVWRQARRRLPVARSDNGANTFTLILDWRPLPDEVVDFWKQRIGANVLPLEAAMLHAVAQAGGAAKIGELAAELKVHDDEAEGAVAGLVRKALATRHGDSVTIADHLIPVALESVPATPAPVE